MTMNLPTRAALVTSLLVAVACSNFEDPQLIIDMRPLAVVANPAEVVVDVDLEAGSILEAIDLGDLVDVELCALVADPLQNRALNYRFTACEPTRSFRCDEPDDDDDISIEFGVGTVADPETSTPFEEMCGTLRVTPVLQNLLTKMVQEDPRTIVQGVDVQIELRVESEDGAEVVYARKSARYSGRLPQTRVANVNPTLDGFTVIREDESEEPLPLGRCVDIEPLILRPGEEITVEPIVPEDAAEPYIVLDLELNPVSLEEALVYNWLTTAGEWRKFSTGGARDGFGNVPLARNRYTAPLAGEFNGDIEVWITQREERFGGDWFRSCVRVSE